MSRSSASVAEFITESIHTHTASKHRVDILLLFLYPMIKMWTRTFELKEIHKLYSAIQNEQNSGMKIFFFINLEFWQKFWKTRVSNVISYHSETQERKTAL